MTLTATKPIDEMNGPELAKLYNQYAEQAGLPQIKKFRTVEIARKRVMAIRYGNNENPPASPDVHVVPLKMKDEVIVHTTDVDFGAREGTNLDRLIKKFLLSVNKPISISDLMIAVYKKATKDNKGKLMMVMNGVKAAIKKKKLPYEVVKSRVDKENYFALCSKK